MNTKAKVALIGLGLVTGASLTAAATASAADSTNFPPMIKQMVEKFNLNEGEVTKLMEENRATRQKENEARFNTTVNQAVTDGKLTEAQKTALLKKHEELQSQKQALTVYGPERREKMQEFRTQMETWMKEQGIDSSVLPQKGQGQGQRGTGMGRGMHRAQ